MEYATPSSSPVGEWSSQIQPQSHTSVCLIVDEELPLMAVETRRVPEGKVDFLDGHADAPQEATLSEHLPYASSTTADALDDSDAATLRIRIHAPKRSPSGKTTAAPRPILKVTSECEGSSHEATCWTESSVLPSGFPTEGSRTLSRASPHNIRERKVKFEGFLTTTSETELTPGPLVSGYAFERTLLTEEDPSGRTYGEEAEPTSKDLDFEMQPSNRRDQSARSSSKSALPIEERSAWNLRLFTASSSEGLQRVMKSTSIIVISKDDASTVNLKGAKRPRTPSEGKGDIDELVEDAALRSSDVLSEHDASGSTSRDRGTRFSWSVTADSDSEGAPSQDRESSSVPQSTQSKTTFQWRARRRRSPRTTSPAPFKRRRPRSSDGNTEHRPQKGQLVPYTPNRKGIPYRPPSYETVTLYPRIARKCSVMVPESPSDDTGFRIRISAGRVKPNIKVVGAEAFGDTSPEAKRLKISTPRRVAVFPQGYYGGGHDHADPLNVYGFYNRNPWLESEYRPRWCKKARKSVSLDTQTAKRFEDEVCFDIQLSEGLTSVTPSKRTGASGSCPLPARTTVWDLEEGRASEGGLIAARSHSETSISSQAADAPTNEADALLQPSVRHEPLMLRLALDRRSVLYASFALVVVFVLTVALLSKNVGTGGSVFEALNDSDFALREDGSSVREYLPKNEKVFCTTAACGVRDEYVQTLLSWELDPCDNFYRFVCDRWRSVVPKGEGESVASVRGDQVALLESSVLTTIHLPNTEFVQLRDLFSECMDTKRLDADGWPQARELLWLATLGGFPFTPSSNASSAWATAARVLRMTGTEMLASLRVRPHPSKRSKSVITVGAPEPLSPVPNDVKETTALYSESARVAAEVFNKSHRTSAFHREVADFAARLEGLASNRTVLHGPSRLMTLGTVPDLLAFVMEVFADENSLAFSGARTDILVDCPGYLDRVLGLVAGTPSHTVLNYIAVRLLVEISPFAPSEGRNLVQVLVQRLYGRRLSSVPRWRLCVRTVESALPPLFLHAVSVETKPTAYQILHLVEAISKQLSKSLDELAILNANARPEAKKLLGGFKVFLFRPSWLADGDKLMAYIGDLPNVVHGRGLLSYTKLRGHSFLEALRGTESWLGSAFDTDCRAEGRTLYLPFAMFNFSTLDHFVLPHVGTRISACLLRLLVRHLTFQTASMTGREWWPDLGHSLLDNAELCFERYATVRVASSALLELAVALKPTLDAYAEVGGTQEGVLETLKAQGVAGSFFVAYAMGYCEEAVAKSNNDDAARLVNVPLWNDRRFQETFRCAVGSSMNPVKKCPLWSR